MEPQGTLRHRVALELVRQPWERRAAKTADNSGGSETRRSPQPSSPSGTLRPDRLDVSSMTATALAIQGQRRRALESAFSPAIATVPRPGSHLRCATGLHAGRRIVSILLRLVNHIRIAA